MLKAIYPTIHGVVDNVPKKAQLSFQGLTESGATIGYVRCQTKNEFCSRCYFLVRYLLDNVSDTSEIRLNFYFLCN